MRMQVHSLQAHSTSAPAGAAARSLAEQRPPSHTTPTPPAGRGGRRLIFWPLALKSVSLESGLCRLRLRLRLSGSARSALGWGGSCRGSWVRGWVCGPEARGRTYVGAGGSLLTPWLIWPALAAPAAVSCVQAPKSAVTVTRCALCAVRCFVPLTHKVCARLSICFKKIITNRKATKCCIHCHALQDATRLVIYVVRCKTAGQRKGHYKPNAQRTGP